MNQHPKIRSKSKNGPNINQPKNRTLNQNNNSGKIKSNDSTYFGLVKAGLKLSHLNIRNLLPKLDEIKQFKFAYQKNNTHIFGVCEIFLTEDITNDMISIEGFALERKDRSEARHKLGGGLTIYFSDLLNHQRRKDLEISNLESIWCQVDLQNSKPLLICYVYRPPDMHQSWIDDFEKEIDYAKESGMEVIILGDINIDYTGGCTNNKWYRNNLFHKSLTPLLELHHLHVP
jgi:hypothetical protein